MNISIVIPAYNRAELLKKTLNSIEDQTSSNWECIVVDDFSNDNTKEVVCEFNKRNERIKYYLNEHKKGAQGARNTGIDHSKYDWVMFFDSDNKMHPDFVEKMIPLISECVYNDVIACCSEIIDIDKGKTGRIMNPRCHGNIHDKLFSGKSYVDFNQAVIRKEKLLGIGGLDEDCPSMQEWDTHIRLSKTAKYDMTSDCLIDYFVGGSDAISSNKKREVIGRLYILRKHLGEWKKRPCAITVFSYRIYNLINKNSDKQFTYEKMNELRSMIPYPSFRIALCKTWYILSKIRKLK